MNRLRFLILALTWITVVGCEQPTSTSFIPPATEAASPVGPPTYTGPVVGVSDGDTIRVLVDGQKHKLRLEGIDTPELGGQPYGRRAKQFTSDFSFGKTAAVYVSGTDDYQRELAHVYVDGESLNEALLAAGLAWHYRYNKDRKLARLAQTAKQQKRGLW